MKQVYDIFNTFVFTEKKYKTSSKLTRDWIYMLTHTLAKVYTINIF